jgi:very-short-patch-repair endonuclease
VKHTAKRILDPQRIKFARSLRRQQTPAERVLWNTLRSVQAGGARFRRQHPIGDYIVDFVNLERKLIIEIDGGQHNFEMVKEQDALRTQWLENEGYRVLRFWNNEVLRNTEGVFMVIQQALE